MFFNKDKKGSEEGLIQTSDKKDKKILQELAHKDKNAFMEAYDLYADAIYRFIYFKVSDSEEAKDLTSAVFLKVWNHIRENGVKEHKTLKSLLYAVARNTIIDHYRKTSGLSKSSLTTQDGEVIEVVDESVDIKLEMDVKADYDLVVKKIYDLKDEYREMIILKYIEELSVTEISNITGKSKGNVRVLLHRSLKTLKELLEVTDSE